MKNISELKAEFEKIAGSGNPERSLAFSMKSGKHSRVVN